MSIHPLLFLTFPSMVSAVDIFRSNDPLPMQAAQLTLIWKTPGRTLNPMAEPLTKQAGLGSSAINLNNIVIEGSFKPVSTNSAETVNQGDIALVSCDSNNSSSLTQDAVVGSIVPNNPAAIVLYSLASAHCDVMDIGPYIQYFTLKNVSLEIMRMLVSTTSANATIRSSPATIAPQSTQNQTPAAGMSALYVIIGIITVLFLFLIIAAWRAHNNPSRYGPRTGLHGRLRQNRAKGLAKAMLETLPILKFGDPLPSETEHRNIELDDTRSAETAEAPQSTVHVTTADNKQGAEEAGPQPDVVAVEADIATTPRSDEPESASQPEAEPSDEHLGCSICTEDFTKGENVRVLPCNHQYHPACIDPWLLNVSGTCPLCRVDLRPVCSNTDETPSPTDAEADETSVVPGGENAHHFRVQRILATRHAPIHERMAILRQLASEFDQQRQAEPSSTTAAAEGPRNRYSLATRIFSGRTRRNSNATEASSAVAPATTAPTAGKASTSPTAPTTNTATEEALPRP